MPRKPGGGDDDVLPQIVIKQCPRCLVSMEAKRYERHAQTCNVDPAVRQREEQERSQRRAEQRRAEELAQRLAERDAERARLEQERIARQRQRDAEIRRQEREREAATEKARQQATLAAERWRLYVLRPNPDLVVVVFEHRESIDGELEHRVWARPGRGASWRRVRRETWVEQARDDRTDGAPLDINGHDRARLEGRLDALAERSLAEIRTLLSRRDRHDED